MKKILFTFGFAVVSAIMILVAGTTEAVAAEKDATVSLVVKMVDGLTANQQKRVISRNGGVRKKVIPALRLHVITVPEVDLDRIKGDYEKDQSVESVELDKTRKTQAVSNDSSVGVQWSLEKIGWTSVYGTVTPNGTARVALLDTGVEATHPDLNAKIVSGFSVFDDSKGLKDSSGHGTNMAGIIAAVTNNKSGIAGIAYKAVKIIPVTVLDASGSGQDSDIIQGVIWAADRGADVILMAFSNADFSQNLQDAVDYAWSKGAVIVSATGNGSETTPTFPAGDRGVIGVSATDSGDLLAPFSNYGKDVFLAAPGTNIYTTALNGSYVYSSGTSVSSAIVAGVAAFMKAVEPTLTNGQIIGRLARSADAIGTPADPDNLMKYGYGRVNMAKALAEQGTETVEAVGAGAIDSGGTVGPYEAASTELINVGTTSWTAPAGITSITVECWGGGGEGGSGGANGVGGGGGGGAYSKLNTYAVTPGTSYSVSVGAGATTTNAGGDTYFVDASTVLAKGGMSVADNIATGAAGGAEAAGVGDIRKSGGKGADGVAGSYGGGGGSSAGTDANGGDGSGATGGTAPAGGGNGGAGRDVDQGNGTAGALPGGGGGGAWKTNGTAKIGGNGADGKIVITYTRTVPYVETVTPWTRIAIGAGPGTITNATFSCGSGSKRLLVAAVVAEDVGGAGGGPQVVTLTATKGTSPTVSFTEAVKTTASAFTGAWIGYLNEAQIAGNTNSIVITNTGAKSWSSADVFLACYSGVDQTTPVVPSGTAQLASDTAGTSWSFADVPAVVNGMLIYANGNNDGSSQQITPPTGWTEVFDVSAGGLLKGIGYKVATETTESGTISWNNNDRYANAVVSLKPAKLDQTITVTTPAPPSAAYGSSFTVAATASSELAVAYSSAGGCTNVGAVFTMTSPTTACTVMYDQTGDSNYNAATQVTSSTTATKADQTITVTTQAPPTGTVNGTFNVVATASSGLGVAITSSGACSGSGTGSATITMSASPGTCTVSYNQVGDASYNAAPQVQETTAVKANPELSVTNSPVFNGSPQAAVVTGSVPGTVSNFKYDGSATAPTNAGTYAVTTDFVPSDTANYNTLTNAPAGSFVIQKATPTATLSVNNTPQTYTGLPQAATVIISSSSVPGSVANVQTGGAASQTNAGTYAVTADFVPTDSTNYNSLVGNSAGSFVIDKATAAVTLSNLTQTYTGSALYPTATTDPGALNIVWTNAPQTSAGSYAVTATVSDANYQGTASGTFFINSGVTYAITASAGLGGSISPLGITSVPGGGSQAYTFTPSAGYQILDVQVDGRSVGYWPTYTFSAVNAPHRINVSFTKSTFALRTITASAGAGGRITPSGQYKVLSGSYANFSIVPNTGCTVSNVAITNLNGIPGTTNLGPGVTSYKFTNVTVDTQTITATFTCPP